LHHDNWKRYGFLFPVAVRLPGRRPQSSIPAMPSAASLFPAALEEPRPSQRWPSSPASAMRPGPAAAVATFGDADRHAGFDDGVLPTSPRAHPPETTRDDRGPARRTWRGRPGREVQILELSVVDCLLSEAPATVNCQLPTDNCCRTSTPAPERRSWAILVRRHRRGRGIYDTAGCENGYLTRASARRQSEASENLRDFPDARVQGLDPATCLWVQAAIREGGEQGPQGGT